MSDIQDILPLLNKMDPKDTKDNILKYLESNSIDAWSNLDKANIYTILGKYSLYTNEYSDTFFYFDLATKYFDPPYDDNKISFLGDYYYHYASLQIEIGNLLKARELGTLCIDYYNEKNDTKGQANALDLLSQIELRFLNLNEALDYAHKSIELYKSINGRLEISYTNIGEIYRIIGNLDLSLEYYEKAIKIAIENNDNYTLAINYNNLGLVYTELGVHESALSYFQKSLETFKLLNIFDIECTIDYTECLIASYNISDSNKDKYIHKIENNLINLRKNLFKTRSNILLFYFFNAIGHYEIKRNNFKAAEEYYLMSLNIAENNGNLLLKIVIQTHLANWALKQYNIDENSYFLEQSQNFHGKAKAIAIETMKPGLLAELMVLEAIIYSNLDIPKCKKILSEVLIYAQKNNNTRLIKKITGESTKISGKMVSGKNDLDLWDFQQYFNSIAKITATNQEN